MMDLCNAHSSCRMMSYRMWCGKVQAICLLMWLLVSYGPWLLGRAAAGPSSTNATQAAFSKVHGMDPLSAPPAHDPPVPMAANSASQLRSSRPCSPAANRSCSASNGSCRAPAGVVFLDRQATVRHTTWDGLLGAIHENEEVPNWAHDEELAPYLYDMEYELPPPEALLHSGHLWDPELRLTGKMHCAHAKECLTPYLPELYYYGDEYMGGWALGGLDEMGPGLRAAIGANAAPPGAEPSDYNYTYIPYTQRILFAPTASLFFPYLLSIYAGELYLAEVDPVLATVGRAARAGIVLNYYYVNNYYAPYTTATVGPSAIATFAATARVRGVVGSAAKARAIANVLFTPLRNDYADNRRQVLLRAQFFGGASAGGYLWRNPLIQNAFLFQNPNTQGAYYSSTYAGAANPFPITA